MVKHIWWLWLTQSYVNTNQYCKNKYQQMFTSNAFIYWIPVVEYCLRNEYKWKVHQVVCVIGYISCIEMFFFVACLILLSHLPAGAPSAMWNYESTKQHSVRSLRMIWWQIGNGEGRARVAMTYLYRPTLATVLGMPKTSADVWRSEERVVNTQYSHQGSEK